MYIHVYMYIYIYICTCICICMCISVHNFEPDPGANWDVYSQRFAPGPVMEKFRNVFLSDMP